MTHIRLTPSASSELRLPHFVEQSIQKDINNFDFPNFIININYRAKHKENDSQNYEISFSSSFKTRSDEQQYIEIGTLDYKEDLDVTNIFNLFSEKIQIMLNCTHDYKRTIIEKGESAGEEYPDGRATCSMCGHQVDKFFNQKKGVKFVDSTFDKYIAKKEWNDKTYLQCGGKGLVVGKNPYRTAFFEAFPEIHGYPTFIRGEGNSIQEAEANCWFKYQSRLNCKSHEFSRKNGKKEYTNGAGVCIHCGLFSSEVFEPITVCHISGKPTTNKLNDKYICYEEYFKLDLNTILQEEKEYNEKINEKYNFHDEEEDIAEDNFYAYLEYHIGKKIFELKGEKFYSKFKHSLTQFFGYYERFLFTLVYNVEYKPFEITYPEMDDPKLKEIAKFIAEEKINDLIDWIERKKSVKLTDFIPEKYKTGA